MTPSTLFEGADVRVERRGRVATLALARPPVNALRTQTWEEIRDALAAVEAAAGLSVLVLRSAVEGIFSAGADVKEFPLSPAADEARQALTRRVLDAVLDSPHPVVAAVDGPALGGGCALACAADIRVGTPRARFGLPEINVGRCGGGRHLMRHVPQGTVRLMCFTGDAIDADHAVGVGLLDLLVDDLEAEVEQLAGRMAAKSPTALRLAKQSLDLAERLDPKTGYQVEQQFTLRLGTDPDAAEAAAAFREKRPPVWADEREADR